MDKMGFKPLVFPKDEFSHNTVIEWWYFNGHLMTESGREFVFMHCLFKADPKKVVLPFLKELPVHDFYFAHSLISDIDKKTFKPSVFLYPELDKDSFKKERLFIGSGKDFVFENTKDGEYHLMNSDLDLTLISKKDPLLIDGKGWIDLGNKNTYYFSLSDLEAKGKIKTENGYEPVSGKVWMDRQWANGGYHPEDKWTWFSIQLENGLDVLCFEYGDKEKTRSATAYLPDGKQVATRNVSFKPLGKTWESPETKAVYELEWLIEIPELNLKIKTIPKNIDQEIIFGNINYWEGGLNIEAQLNDKKIKGIGFLEIVGAPMHKSLAKIYLKKGSALINNPELLKKYFEKGKEFIFSRIFRP
ncbi:MAG: lipocalin family protein [bacterium]|nr:lipocalin family protein [bacterium]